MANKRIKDLATTATTTASGDFIAVDGVTNGTRKLSAAAPAFLTSVTTPSLTSPAATNLTLAGGTAGSDSVVVSNTLAASSAIIGAFKVGNGTAATNVAIGGGNINAGGTGTFGGNVTVLGRAEFQGNQNATYWKDAAGNGNFLTGIRTDYAPASTFVFSTLANGTAWLFDSGTVSISNSTAGSAGAGALVVTGGLSAGQSAQASWFGGEIVIGANNTKLSWSVSGAYYNWIESLGGAGTGQMRFATGNAEAMRIGVSQNVLIGTTTDAGQKLQVNGAATFAGAVAIGNTVGTGVAVASTHKVTIVIGGTTYYLLASNV
jgi:hypothetical protein